MHRGHVIWGCQWKVMPNKTMFDLLIIPKSHSSIPLHLEAGQLSFYSISTVNIRAWQHLMGGRQMSERTCAAFSPLPCVSLVTGCHGFPPPAPEPESAARLALYCIVFYPVKISICEIKIVSQRKNGFWILMFRPDLISMECCIGIEQDLSKRKLKVIASTFSLIELVEFVRLICVSCDI